MKHYSAALDILVAADSLVEAAGVLDTIIKRIEVENPIRVHVSYMSDAGKHELKAFEEGDRTG